MKKIISTKNAPQAIGPYSQAVEAEGLIFISGQLPVDPQTGNIVEGDITKQTDKVMQNIGAILKESGCSFSDVVKSTVLLQNIEDFKAMNEVYGKYYPENPPSRAAYQVAKLPLGAMIEIETIALKKNR